MKELIKENILILLLLGLIILLLAWAVNNLQEESRVLTREELDVLPKVTALDTCVIKRLKTLLSIAAHESEVLRFGDLNNSHRYCERLFEQQRSEELVNETRQQQKDALNSGS